MRHFDFRYFCHSKYEKQSTLVYVAIPVSLSPSTIQTQGVTFDLPLNELNSSLGFSRGYHHNEMIRIQANR